jgi:hypothetical protein
MLLQFITILLIEQKNCYGLWSWKRMFKEYDSCHNLVLFALQCPVVANNTLSDGGSIKWHTRRCHALAFSLYPVWIFATYSTKRLTEQSNCIKWLSTPIGYQSPSDLHSGSNVFLGQYGFQIWWLFICMNMSMLIAYFMSLEK